MPHLRIYPPLRLSVQCTDEESICVLPYLRFNYKCSKIAGEENIHVIPHLRPSSENACSVQ